ncbi:thioredoxin domain-containing protein [Citrobacter meridianamericanus]|uniref:DsbA family protein n=1 Tax=Citrobacter meridianamericanus TaxID=2894201 RepID=UPI00351D1A21
MATNKATTAFTPEQETRIGEVVKEYLLAHPEVLAEVSQKLLNQQQEQQWQGLSGVVLQNLAELMYGEGTPSYGPDDAKVIVVEFFDYRCIDCALLAPEIKNVMTANPQVRFVFKEWPTFGRYWEDGRHWDDSKLAAKTGLQIWQQKGADAYLEYHNAIYATGHTGDKLTKEDVITAAKAVKFNTKTATDVQRTLDNIHELSQQLGFSGPPVLVVFPSIDASAENISVILGFTQATDLQKAIDKASTTKNSGSSAPQVEVKQ